MDFFISEFLDSFLPLACFFKLLLEDYHFGSDVGVGLLLFVEVDQLGHFELFVLWYVLDAFGAGCLYVAFPFDIFGKLNTLTYFLLNISRCRNLDLMKNGQVIFQLLFIYSIC